MVFEDDVRGRNYSLSMDIWPEKRVVSGRQWILLEMGGNPTKGCKTFYLGVKGRDDLGYSRFRIYATPDQGVSQSPSNWSSQRELAVLPMPVGGGTTSGSGMYADGTRVPLSATPSAGYEFDGWYDPDSGQIFSASANMDYTVTGSDRTIFARFRPKAGAGTGGDAPAPFPVLAFTAAKAKVLDGAVYDAAGNVAGVIRLKVAKPNAKRRTTKVSGSVTLLDGKRRSLKAATAAVPADAPVAASAAVKGLGTLAVRIGDDGFSGTLGAYAVRSAKVGGRWSRGAGVSVAFSGGLPAGTLDSLLPDAVPVAAKGGKWAFAKAASVKLKKGALTVDTAKGRTNLSAMKLTYAPKTGLFKGSFKLYAIQGGKLKKFTAKVTGVVVEDSGAGVAKLAKPAATWSVAVE